MNKTGIVVAACLSLVIFFLVNRLAEAERKITKLEARPLPSRMRNAPGGSSNSNSSPNAAGDGQNHDTVRSALVDAGDSAITAKASERTGPSSRDALNEPRTLRDITTRPNHVPWSSLEDLSTGFIPAGTPAIIEHWTGGDKRRWGHEQAAGEPDTGQPGDIPTAWASKAPDGGEEWIQLDYDRAVDLQQVSVVESHNPGAISKVVAVLPDGTESPIWEGTMEPSTGDELVSSDFKVGSPVRAQSVKVYLDTARVPGWNEIDAVQIVGRDGSKQWASASSASSSYADR
jgi:hypothetical protein